MNMMSGIRWMRPISLSFKFHKDQSSFGRVISRYIEGSRGAPDSTHWMNKMTGMTEFHLPGDQYLHLLKIS